MLKIEKGLPVPSVGDRLSPRSLIPWREMQKGDSVLVPPDVVARYRRTHWSNLACEASKRLSTDQHKVKFATRAQENGGVRIYRVA